MNWVRANRFEPVSAGKGNNFAPSGIRLDTVWGYFGWSEAEVAAGVSIPKCIIPQMAQRPRLKWQRGKYNGLSCAEEGLGFYHTGLHDLANVFKPLKMAAGLKQQGW